MKWPEYQALVAMNALGGIATFRHVAKWATLSNDAAKQNLNSLYSDGFLTEIGHLATSHNGGTRIYQITARGEHVAKMSFHQICRRGATAGL